MRLFVVTHRFFGAPTSDEPHSHASQSDVIARNPAVNAMMVALHAREGALSRPIREVPGW
jgi:hypothetical protein